MMTYVELLNKYQGMIWKVLRKFPSRFSEDLYQEACIGLWKAYKSGNQDSRTFSSFVYSYIHGSCCRFMRDKTHLVRISARKAEQGETVDCQSLNQVLFENEGNSITLEQLIGSEFQDLDGSLDFKCLMNKVYKSNILSQEEKLLLYKRGYQEKDYKTLSKEFGLSAPSIVNRYHRLIAKLRPYFIGTKVFSRKK